MCIDTFLVVLMLSHSKELACRSVNKLWPYDSEM